jgi:hypothetical protein
LAGDHVTGAVVVGYVPPSATAALLAGTPKELTATRTTQNSINISKAGTLILAISNVGGEVDGDTRTTYQLFNGSMFTLQLGSNIFSSGKVIWS